MRVRLPVHDALLWTSLCMLVLAPGLCVGENGPSSAATLEKRIATLRGELRYDEAAKLAEELLSSMRADRTTKQYQITSTEWLLRTLKFAANLPRESQQELTDADHWGEKTRELYAEGNYAAGASAAQRQLEIRRRILGGEHPDVASSLNNLASLLMVQGDNAGAEPLYSEALAMRRRLLGGEHPDIAASLNNMSNLRREQGEYADAQQFCREGLVMRRKLLGDEHPDVASSLNSLANLYRDQGDYAGAEPLFREALAMRRRLLGEEHPHVAWSLENLANLLSSQGDYTGAVPLLREALAMNRNLLGEEHPDVAASLNNLAAQYYELDDYDAAEPLYREALAMNRKLLGDEHPDVATCLTNLGSLLEAQGDYVGADSLFRQALAMRRELLGEGHPSVASSLNSLANSLRDHGDYGSAEPLYREALAMTWKLLGEEHPYVAMILGDLAGLYLAGGHYTEAETMLAEAAQVYDAARLRVGEGIERSTFMSCPYPSLAAVRLRLGRADQAWPANEKALSRSLADLLFTAESRKLNSTEAGREDSLRRVLDDLERQLAAHTSAAEEEGTAEAASRVTEARNQLLDAEARWSTFQREIAVKYPVSEGQAYPLERVQSVLPERAAILGWLDVEETRGKEVSWGYVIRAHGPVTWARLDSLAVRVSSPTPGQKIRSFRNALTHDSASLSGIASDCSDLWAERVEPLATALEGVEDLIVVSSGAMAQYPVEVLIDSDGEWLGDTYAISYTPSATIYAWLQEQVRDRERAPGARALLVGDPPFNSTQKEAMMSERADEDLYASSEDRIEPAVVRSAIAGNEDALAALPRLEGTRAEIRSIASVLPEAEVLLGPAATEQELVRLAAVGGMRSFGTIHLATHALIDQERPERCCLVLSQVDLPEPLAAAIAGERVYDGLLTTKEILREWELDADLVTLSACETALGKVVGGEGTVGFEYVFLQAGARSLIQSLWKVDDRATALLMRRFYEDRWGKYTEERNGHLGTPMTKAEALREAKQWLRDYTNAEGQKTYAHPYYWSAFVLVGERN